MSLREPHFGYTKLGHAVHHLAVDHLPDHSGYARLNKRIAIAVTNSVGSMTCAYLFCLLALLSLPAVLTQAFHVRWFPGWLVAVGLIALVAWIAQTFLQLVLLSVIMVGQSVQQAAGDARAAKTFEDAELALDRLDTHTEGGITEILAAVSKLEDQVANLAGTSQKVMAARVEHESAVASAARDAHAEAKTCREELRALVASVTALLRDPPARDSSEGKGGGM